MENKDIELLIAKHLAGELNAAEELELRLWLNSNPKRKEEYNKIALTYQLSTAKGDHERKEKVLNNIRGRIDQERGLELRDHTTAHSSRSWWIAAAVVVFMAVGSLLFYYADGGQSSTVKPGMTQKMNPSGQKSKIILPDGSVVWLNSESTLSYKKDFSDSIREVILEGEAYFEVKRDVERPFIVRSGEITTTVLGTSFNVSAFKGKPEILVSLVSGKVQVQHGDPGHSDASYIISPGEGVFYNPFTSNKFDKIDIDIEEVQAWKDGTIILNNASLAETEERLERWYGVTFEYRNKPNREWKVTGHFKNEYLENVLNNISFFQEFDFEIEGKTVYVTFK